MNRFISRGMVLVLLFCGAGCVGEHTSSSGPSEDRASVGPANAYLARLTAGIQRARMQMPEIIRSAEQAARNVGSGRHLYVAGSQTDFVSEFSGRAGGLEDLQPAPKLLDRGDVVLYGVRSRFTNNDKLTIARWRDSGAAVIAFASKTLSKEPYFPADTVIDSGAEPGLVLRESGNKICPTDSVINLINGWTWTGEFISACTRLGKMPVVYRSYGLEGGRAWAEKHRGNMFHDDLTVRAIDTGTVGSAYLDHLERYLQALQADAPPALARAAQWLNEAGPARSGVFVMGHLFPDHYQDARAPRPFGTMTNWEALPAGHMPPMSPLTVMIGYQRPPQLLIDLARQRRIKLVYTSVERARDDDHENVIYLDPHWPIEDACVTLSDYPQPMLPASGVMQAAIYWSMVAAASQ